MTQLAFTYACVARIMNANGYSDEEIKDFLVANQNESGYIKANMIPAPKKIFG